MGSAVWLGAAGAITLFAPSAAARPYECGTYVYREAHIANGKRGDILLTRVEGAPAGAVTDPLGQTYTHSGILTDDMHVRHNTSILHDASAFDSALGGAFAFVNAIGNNDACYRYASVPVTDLRRGAPGLGTNAISELGSLKPWNPGYLRILKARDEAAARAGAMAAATASEGMSMTYDVYSYKDYDAAIAQGNSMCSGAVKRATDLAGVGGFELHAYTQDQVNQSALSLFSYIYSRAHDKIDAKDSIHTFLGTAHLLSWQCREKMAAGLANEVVDCFASGACNRGNPKWSDESQNYWRTAALGAAMSISPDDLVNNQPASLYQSPIDTQIIPAGWELQSKTCDDGKGEIGDYDGDDRTDFAVYRPSEGRFYVLTQTGQTLTRDWGVATDIPIWGDYDGDRTTDYTVWRANADGPSSTTFVLGIVNRGGMGTATSVPIPEDYDGDGKTDYAYYDPGLSRWAWAQKTGPASFVDFGASGHAGTVAVPADYDGDGKADLAVWRPWSGEWVVRRPGAADAVQKLATGAIAVPGDYDGDRKADYVTFSMGQWNGVSATGKAITMGWGTVGDIAVPGDYDGDGKTDFAVWRPGNPGIFFVIFSSKDINAPDRVKVMALGKAGDVPVLGRVNR